MLDTGLTVTFVVIDEEFDSQPAAPVAVEEGFVETADLEESFDAERFLEIIHSLRASKGECRTMPVRYPVGFV